MPKRFNGLATSALLAIGGTNAAAQQPAGSASGADQLSTDIVVTARRSQEDIQRVPVSVVAFSDRLLREASITTPEDVMHTTPGIYLVGSGSRLNSVFSIRGQTRATLGFGQPAVVSYFAEVPDPTLGSATALYDMGSVQVLKGPQGTLFGRNTTGGAVLFDPKAPDWTTGGYAQGEVGNYQGWALEGALNVPIVADRLALRVAGQLRRRDGFTKNVGAGHDVDDVHSDAVRASLLFEPVADIRNTLIVDYYRSDTRGSGAVLEQVLPGASLLDVAGLRSGYLAQLALLRAGGSRTFISDIEPYERLKRLGITNRTEVDIGNATFTNIFGYRDVKLAYLVNLDGVGLVPADGTGILPAGTPVSFLRGALRSHIRQYTDEVQLRGTAFSDRLEWLVGGFYLKSEPRGTTGSDIDVLSVGTSEGAPFAYQFYDETSKALFANLSFELTEGLKLNAGFRRTWDKARACTAAQATNTSPLVGPDECDAGSPLLAGNSVVRASSGAPTWTVGLDWQATEDLFLYVTSRRGYRSGGINPPRLGGTLTPFQTFGPEKVTDVEVGVRSQWQVGDVRGRLNVSAFRADYRGVQIGLTDLRTTPVCVVGDPVLGVPPNSPDGNCDPSDDPAGSALLANLGKTRVQGIEADAAIELMRGLSLDASTTLLDFKTRSLSAGPVLRPFLTADEVPFQYSPKTSFTAGARYETALPGSLGSVVLNADYYWSGKVLLNNYLAPSYDLVNARAAWNDIGSAPVDLSVFVRNLFDKRYASAGGVSGAVLGAIVNFYGEPRMVGAQLRYRFAS